MARSSRQKDEAAKQELDAIKAEELRPPPPPALPTLQRLCSKKVATPKGFERCGRLCEEVLSEGGELIGWRCVLGHVRGVYGKTNRARCTECKCRNMQHATGCSQRGLR